MLETIALEALADVIGGSGAEAAEIWEDARDAARPHCPRTVARFPNPPKTRARAEAIGEACLTEMGAFKAMFGGRAQIEDAIDEAFPRR